jgi:NADP-dependent 3-hydroxy acid dehydrogenase YdfG
MHNMTRTILVTGASSGIGKATTEKLLHLGHRVIGISRDITRLTHNSNQFSSVEMDLSDLQKLPEQIKILEKQHPEIDTVIFSAGMGQFGSLEEFSYAQIELLLATNFTSQVFLAKGLISRLKQKPYSDLVFIGSEAALKGTRKGTVYCASKFALRGFTQALREECGKSNVRVSLINPGMVKTAFFDPLSFEPGNATNQHLLAEDVAEAVYYILNARPGIVIDEINLTPANRVVKAKNKNDN